MPEHSEKFIFLGVVVALALFSRIAYPGFYQFPSGGPESPAGNTSLAADVPLLILPSSSTLEATQSSSDGAATMLNGGTIAVGAAPAGGTSSDAPTSTAASSSFARVGTVPAPSIVDEASLVADLKSGTVFFGTNPDTRWPLASVTKLMTAALVADDLNLSQKVTIPPEAVAADPSQQTFVAGETYTVSDLLHFLLLPSSNVAAEALADYYGRTRFVAQMNARAQSWGMTNTHYDDPSGLSAGNQSTPDDLLVLAQKIYANYPQVLAVTRTPQTTVTELNSGRGFVVRSINNFAGRADFIGGKTGYTDEAAGNLLSIFKYEGRPILIIVMGTSDDQRFDNTLMLYNWFVANYK